MLLTQNKLNIILLNQTNFDAIFESIHAIKTIASAADCLASINKLTEKNFKILLKAKYDALAFAIKIEGVSSEQNAGIKNYSKISQIANLLFKGHKKDLFFKPLQNSFDSEKIKMWQDEALIKIANYCGNGTLEETTEFEIAKKSYRL